MAISKVVYGNNTLIDLTGDSVDSSVLLTGYTAHGADGNAVVGACSFDSDTTDADATPGTILDNKTAYVNKQKVTGSMPNRGEVHGTISTVSGTYSIQNGYHDGSGDVGIDSTEQAKIIAQNIKNGVEILGVTGTYAGEATPTQSKTATPYTTSQTVLPDAGYALSQVSIDAIYYNESPASVGGGTVVTIGTVAPSA